MRLRMLMVLLAAVVLGGCGAGQREFSMLGTDGSRFVDEQGEEVVLKGCNVGNWFLLETWMHRIDRERFPDQYSFERNLERRFGAAKKNELMELYRASWVTERDFAIIKSFGFDVIRLPFNYRLLEDDERPFEVKPEGFGWLDRAIEMAADAGLYVILDMHGVPGGQSKDHPTGRVDQNKLWDDPVYAARTAHLWKEIARRYGDRAEVAGYDVMNEPYSNFGDDIRDKLAPIFEQIYRSIREVDPEHIVFAPAPLWGGFDFYGDPEENGWVDVAYTEHHYPGLFGEEPTPETHRGFIENALPEKEAYSERVGVAMFIGEWNPIFEDIGGPDLIRRYYEEYGRRGWWATIWSYKVLHEEGGAIENTWPMVTNAEPLPSIDYETASYEEIAAHFRWFATMEYAVDEAMREALTRPEPAPIEYLPALR